jgi:hypothetical protein
VENERAEPWENRPTLDARPVAADAQPESTRKVRLSARIFPLFGEFSFGIIDLARKQGHRFPPISAKDAEMDGARKQY